MNFLFLLAYTGIGTLVGAFGVWFFLRPKSASVPTDSGVSPLQQNLQSSDATLEAVAGNTQALRQQIAQQELALDAARQDLAQALEKVATTMQALSDEAACRAAAEHRADGLRQQVAALAERCEQLECKLAEQGNVSEPEVASLTERASSAEAALATRSGEIEALRAQVANQQRMLQTSAEELASAHRELDESRNELKGEIDALRAQVADQQRMLQTGAEELASAHHQIDEARNELTCEIQVLRAQAADQQRRLETDGEELASQPDLASLTERAANAEAGLAASAEEIDTLRAQVAHQLRMLQTSAEDVASVRHELDESRNELKGENDALCAQVADQQRILQTGAEELASAHHQLDEARNELKREIASRAVADRILAEMGCEVDLLKQRCMEFEISSREDKLVAEASQKQAASVEAQLAAEKRLQEDQSREIVHLQQELDGHYSAQQALAGRSRDLETELARERARTRQLTDHVSELQSRWSLLDSNLREQVRSATEKIQSLATAHERFSLTFNTLSVRPLNGAGVPDEHEQAES